MAASGPRKKFANSNLNTLLGAPKESAKANYGPAVRSGGVVKPVAKPKGLVSLGKAPASSTVSARKGAAWNQLEEEAKKRAEEESAKHDDSRPNWAVIDPKEEDDEEDLVEEPQDVQPENLVADALGGDAGEGRCEDMAITEPSAPSIRRENRPPPPNVPPPSAPPPQPVAPAPLPPMSMTAVPPPVPTHCNARVEAQPLARDLVDVELHSAKVRSVPRVQEPEAQRPQVPDHPPFVPERQNVLQETEFDAAKVRSIPRGQEPQAQRPQAQERPHFVPQRQHVVQEAGLDATKVRSVPRGQEPEAQRPHIPERAPFVPERRNFVQETELDAAKVRNLYGGREPQSQRSQVQERPPFVPERQHVQELGTVSRPPKEIVAKVEDEAAGSEESFNGDDPPPEHAVLDLMVPRTALVVNISHVLKRLNGCCSLNQLTKQIRSFKEKTGVSLEAFLRANPTTFKLEGRIVYLVDRDGELWKPALKQEKPAIGEGNPDRGGKAHGKGKNEAKTRSGGEAARGKSGHKGDQHFARSDGGFERNGKGAVRGKGRQWTGNGHWSQDWDEWEETDWKADRGWKGSW